MTQKKDLATFRVTANKELEKPYSVDNELFIRNQAKNVFDFENPYSKETRNWLKKQAGFNLEAILSKAKVIAYYPLLVKKYKIKKARTNENEKGKIRRSKRWSIAIIILWAISSLALFIVLDNKGTSTSIAVLLAVAAFFIRGIFFVYYPPSRTWKRVEINEFTLNIPTPYLDAAVEVEKERHLNMEVKFEVEYLEESGKILNDLFVVVSAGNREYYLTGVEN